MNEEPRGATEVEETAQVADLEALALHAIELSGALERAWSQALNESLMEAAEEQLNTEFGAVVSAMMNTMQSTDARLRAAGVDPRIYEWPYDPDYFKSLEADPDSVGHRSQLVVAQLIAVRELLAAYKALTEPSGERGQLRDGSLSIERWFESGAFSLFRERARLLLRVTREVDRSSKQLLGEPGPRKRDLMIEASKESLTAALLAQARGDIEAALFHARSALGSVLRSLPFFGIDDERLLIPGNLLAEVPSLTEFASALRLLDATVDRMGDGPPSFGVGVPLADGILPLVSRIVHAPPITELEALFGEEAEEC
jgi:hypothetical protein